MNATMLVPGIAGSLGQLMWGGEPHTAQDSFHLWICNRLMVTADTSSGDTDIGKSPLAEKYPSFVVVWLLPFSLSLSP
jgi:hypothetical protein